ncbi:transmembrane 6 superfamily member 2 isoform X3 [Acinonyx jubatus]|uniref:Transmembrane 6 superfamily member 2 isoform X3 n=2 Tax=Felinae TaxID=338152 RepID=A0A6J1XP15_ACIJB|nr:transmembrane 6 superfamily member 2 isoform X3 [Acinonyx jubatus]
MQGQVAGQLDQTPLVPQGISPARTLGREDAPLQKRRAPRRPRRGTGAAAMDIPPLAGKIAALSLGALPLSYALNYVSALSHPLGVALMSALILGLLFMAIYNLSPGDIYYDPLYAVFTIFAFTSVVDLLIALQEDGYMVGFMEFITKEGEPYLRTAHGVFICYWDGTVHYLLYLAMAGAIHRRKRYRNLGLYWLGSFIMSILVFLPGNILGKYSSEIRPAFFLAIPYMLVPCWAGMRVFSQSRAPTSCIPHMVQEEQRKGLLRRPVDLVLVIYLTLAGFFTLFRGLVVLDCPTDACFIYIYQYEPYLRDPVAYPKVQMLVYMFYVLPFYGLAVYALIVPGCSWLPDWALVFAGAVGQAQFSHMGASMHLRTPFTYRVPDDAWACFFGCNLLYALGPHLLAFRCLQWPAFFLRPPPGPPAHHKKQH